MSKFEIMYPEGGLMSKTVEAYSAESAAEKFAEERDPHWDYTMLSGNTIGLLVRENNEGSLLKYLRPKRVCKSEWEYFEVTGQLVPQYSATPVDTPTDSKFWKDILEYIAEEAVEEAQAFDQ